MSYSSGGLIQATDYNSRVTSINAVWGTGSGNSGYGQSTTLGSVSTGATVTAANWASVISLLNTINTHQSGSGSGITAPSSGGKITWLSTLDTVISNIGSNKLACNNTRGTSALIGNPGATNSTQWYTSSTKEFTVTFSNTNTVRYFFNAGGYIYFYITQTGGSTSKSTDWGNFYTNTVGTINLGSSFCSRTGTGGDGGFPGSGGSPTANTGVGYWSLTTTYQTLFEIGSTSGTADYGQNYFLCQAKLGSTANIVQFICTSYDAASDTFNDQVNGANAIYVGYVPPETTYLTNTWGTPSYATVTNTQS